MSIGELLTAELKKLVSAELGGKASAKPADDATFEDKCEWARKVWFNNGWLDQAEKENWKTPAERSRNAVQFNDIVNFLQPDKAAIFFPKVITQVVREAAEPVLVLANFFRKVGFHGETIEYPAISASMHAEDIGPAGSYPEGSIEASGITTAKIGKVGLAFKISDEVLRYSAYDIANLYYRAAGRALARRKEQKCADLMAAQIPVAFDNSNTAAGELGDGHTTGRGSDGVFNGTLTLDDILTVLAGLADQGYLPNTLFMNAVGWLIFARSPELRAFGFANGGSMWQALQGSPGRAPTFGQGGVNLGPAGGLPLSSGNPQLNPQATTYTDVPNLFPMPMAIVVSPFIRFNATTQRTDIIVADRMELGAILQDEEPTSESWDQPERDVRYTKVRERYAVVLDNHGQSAFQMKNIKTIKGYDWDDVRVWQALTGTLPTSTAGL